MTDEETMDADQAHVLPEKEVEYEESANMGRWIAEMTRHERHPLAKDYWAWKEDWVRSRQVITSEPSETTPKDDSVSIRGELIHKYRPLKGPQSLRLFRIFDVDLDAHEIFGCFYEEALVHNINSWFEAKGRLYEALSYTWQQPVEGILEDPTEQPWTVIICQRISRGVGSYSFTASKITLGHNLAAYLKAVINAHVRKQVPLAFEIWIDALCIDQSNAAEKQAQIELMGNIYRAATEVHIWLGENTKDWVVFKWVHDVLLEAMVQFITGEGEKCWDTMSAYEPTNNDFWNKYLPDLQPPGVDWAQCWESYWRFLFERRWFRRAWTFQEALLAREIVVMCGPDLEQISFRSVTNMVRILHESRWRPLLNMRFPHPSVKINPNKALLNLDDQSRYVDKYINRSPRYEKDKPTPMSEEEWLKAWRNWCGVIRLRECAYLGDRIRATIGIANITRPPSIGEDFFRETAELDVDSLYRWMSTVFITRSTNLDHLSEVGPRTRLNATWVADYTLALEFGSVSDVKRFNAFPGKSLGEDSVVDKILRVIGLQVGIVKSLGGTGDMTLPEWCLEHLFHLPEKYGWMENQSSVEALWRTLIWDTNDIHEEPDDSWAVQFKEWIESHYIIRSIFPGYRSSLSGEDTLTQAWWDRAEQQLQHAEKVARTCGHPAGPSLEKIRTTASAIQQHANWQSAAVLPDTIQDHAHPWDQIFIKTSEMIPDFRIVYNKAYWSPFAQRVSATLQGRTIITTPSGFLGVAHQHCAVGDEIWVLSGGRVAYALERFDPNKFRTDDPLSCDMHEFHGDCYIHGIMEGEFVVSMMQSGGSKLLKFLYIL